MIVEPSGERTMLPDRGANAALAPADLPIDEFTAGAHLHLSGYTLLDPGSRPAGLVAIEHARAAGMSISVDPASAAPLQEVGPAHVPRLGAPRRPAAPQRGGGGGADRRARPRGRRLGARPRRARGGDHARRGRRAVVRRRARRARRAPSPAPAQVDSTGAGDAFTAGWLASRLRGAEPAEALAAANFAAAQVLKDAGAR